MQFSHRMSAATRIPPPHQLTERVIDDVLPQPQLTLVSGRERSRWEYVLEHRAALVFTYNGQPTVDRNPEVMILNGTETQRIQRQPAVEKACARSCKSTASRKATRKSSLDRPGEMFTSAG